MLGAPVCAGLHLFTHPPQAHAQAALAEELSGEKEKSATADAITGPEQARQVIASRSDALTQRLDNFFDDPRIEAEAARTRLELRHSASFIERDDNKSKTRLSVKVKLPSLSRRASLTFQNEAEEELEDGHTEFKDEDSLDDPCLGLQYVFQEQGSLHGSWSIGTRLGNPSINFGPRLRYSDALSKNWRARHTQRILFDTDDRWEARIRVEFDRALDSGTLFQQSLRADWRESRQEPQGIRYTVTSAYIHRLRENAAIRYQVASRHQTKPRTAWVCHTLRTRYRRNVRYDWMFFEMIPFIAFDKEYDRHPNPGIRLSLDIAFAPDAGL